MSARIAVFASGKGTNAEEIFKHFQTHPSIEVVLLLCNDADAFVLKRASQFGIPARVFSRHQLLDGEVLGWLAEFHVTHIVLAGFIWLIPETLLQAYENRIINIHPALLPKFGGKGMYGLRVHEQVKATGESTTGITIHLVNARYDEGKILFQASCLVSPLDSPQEIAGKVSWLEHEHYSRVIEGWIGVTS